MHGFSHLLVRIGCCVAVAVTVALALPSGAQAAEFTVKKVAVECNGGCSDSTLAQICGSGWKPIAVDCGDVQETTTTSACGGNNRCHATLVSGSQSLGLYCDDGSGFDANVYCTQP